jgi:hypothetical protein
MENSIRPMSEVNMMFIITDCINTYKFVDYILKQLH